jgi:eukaryotic-like serine/threonine-protein kinase
LKQPIPFGKYFLLERVNVGGMAEVFKAKATGVEGFERLVAVKRILPNIAEDEEFITMFIDEAKIAVQLTHANVAQIFDLGRVDGSFFIALEYIHGKDLRAIFNRARQRGELLPIPMSCYAIMKLCEGLDYAHNKRDAAGGFLNLVHRDVSPQNILVSYEGEVKIIDFGIAKAAGKAGRTQAGILKGKFGYMSPEQVQGMEIDRRSDVFGVGICLYELLTSERLFVGESDFATLEKVRNVDIMPPSTYNRRVPEELEQIVLKALARDREERYQTAMQLHDDLQSFMYTSGNFFSRKDLSLYMHKVFNEEIEKEKVRDQEYASLDAGVDLVSESTGLHAFDELEPVSSVSALNPQPMHQTRQPRAAGPASNPNQAAGRKATLLGMPTASRMPTPQPVVQRSVPGMVPRAQSIPPTASRPGLPMTATPQVQGGGRPQSGLGMEWDDEELSTQIYDKPDELSLDAIQTGPQPASGGGSLPPVLLGATPQSSPAHPAFAQARVPSGAYAPAPTSGAYAPARGQGSAPPRLRNDPTISMQDEPPAWGGRSRGKPVLWAALAVVGILALIVGGLFVFGKADPASVQLTTAPRDALVTINGRPHTGRTSPFLIGELEPHVMYDIEVSSPGYRPWSTKVELQPGQMVPLPDVSLEKIEAGFALDSAPRGATVFVDGRRLPQSTPVRVTDLEPGDHQIRLEYDGYAPWESALHVTPGTVLELQVASLKALGAEVVAAVPSGSAAQAVAAPAAPAPRVATSSRPRRASSTPVVRSSAPEPEPVVRVAPAPAPSGGGGTGTLRVNTRPWSKVFVDGRLIGNTPQMNISLSAGRHTITLVNDDFGIRKTVKVDIRAGEVETQVLTLTE